VKGGWAALDTRINDSRLAMSQKHSNQLALGLAARMGIKDSPWQLRMDIDSYDRDARVFTLGVNYRFH
jgi:hypothetical protein